MYLTQLEALLTRALKGLVEATKPTTAQQARAYLAAQEALAKAGQRVKQPKKEPK